MYQSLIFYLYSYKTKRMDSLIDITLREDEKSKRPSNGVFNFRIQLFLLYEDKDLLIIYPVCRFLFRQKKTIRFRTKLPLRMRNTKQIVL